MYPYDIHFIILILILVCAKDHLNRMESMLTVLQNTVEQQTVTIQQQDSKIQQQELINKQQESKHQQQESKHQQLELIIQQQAAAISSGSTYVIWGRKQCPPNNYTEQVYSGFAGGGSHDQPGSASDYVCLSPDPIFIKTSALECGRMYGAEYESNFWAANSQDEDVPCALCRTTHATTVMIPGTNVCNNGWNRQYYGYLASGADIHIAASSFVCVDVNPEYRISGVGNHDGKLFYSVLAKCGSLPCPPYINNHPLTCVVCSK